MIAALISFAILIALLFLRVPVAFSMAAVGIFGFAQYVSWPGTLSMVGRLAYDTAQSSELSVIPLFVLMGSFITRAGLADELYTAAHAWIGHKRGGLA
ncbi:MAG: TRAP transporter large permease subunit, partial [Rhodospirillales bacterium]|nr:TRAP transporter large permease subunit [Rhodospirillales bacterium]